MFLPENDIKLCCLVYEYPHLVSWYKYFVFLIFQFPGIFNQNDWSGNEFSIWIETKILGALKPECLWWALIWSKLNTCITYIGNIRVKESSVCFSIRSQFNFNQYRLIMTCNLIEPDSIFKLKAQSSLHRLKQKSNMKSV